MSSLKNTFRQFCEGNSGHAGQRQYRNPIFSAPSRSPPRNPSLCYAQKYGVCPSDARPRCCNPHFGESKKMGYRVEDLIAPVETNSCRFHSTLSDRHPIAAPYPYGIASSTAPPPMSTSTGTTPRIVATQIIIPAEAAQPTSSSSHASYQSPSHMYVSSEIDGQPPSQPVICGTIDYQQLKTTPVIVNQDPAGPAMRFTQLQAYSSLSPPAALGARPPSPSHYKKRARVKFSAKQLKTMNEKFKKMMYLDKNTRSDLAKELGVTETQLKNFWQNKRMKVKQQKLRVNNDNKPAETSQKSFV